MVQESHNTKRSNHTMMNSELTQHRRRSITLAEARSGLSLSMHEPALFFSFMGKIQNQDLSTSPRNKNKDKGPTLMNLKPLHLDRPPGSKSNLKTWWIVSES